MGRVRRGNCAELVIEFVFCVKGDMMLLQKIFARGARGRSLSASLVKPIKSLPVLRPVAWLFLLLCLPTLRLFAAEPNPHQPTGSKAARDEAVKSIPFDKLSEKSKVKVNGVLGHTTLYRRLPVEIIDCDPDLHYFLARHPDVVTNIWDILDISKVTMQRTGPNSFRATDGAGTAGNIEYLYSDADTHVIFCDGIYDGPLLPKKVRGECLMILRAGYVRETNGRYYVTNRLDMFVRLDNFGVEFMAKTFQPVINKCADANFTDTTGFLSSLSRSAENSPGGIERLSAKLKKIDQVTRDEFVQVASGIAERADLEAVANRPQPRRAMAQPVSASVPAVQR